MVLYLFTVSLLHECWQFCRRHRLQSLYLCRCYPRGAPALTTALVDCSHLLLLPIWAQILAQPPLCSPTVSQTAQPCGCMPGGQANCSAPMLPTAHPVLAGRSLLAATWCIFCAHTYASLPHGLPLKHASSKRKILRISRRQK